MSTKFFLMVFCYLWTIEVQTALPASSSDLPIALTVELSRNQSFDKSEVVSQESGNDTEGEKIFTRGSLLACQSFCERNQEEIERSFDQLRLKMFDIDLAFTRIDEKLFQLDEVKKEIEKKLLEIVQIRQEFARYVENVQAILSAIEEKVDYNFDLLNSKLLGLHKKIDEINAAKVSHDTLTSNGPFMNEVEKILAKLLLEKYLKPSVQASSDDNNNDDDSLPSGRASTRSHYSPKLSLGSFEELDS